MAEFSDFVLPNETLTSQGIKDQETLIGATVNNGGTLVISNGGRGSSIAVNDGGTLVISNGGWGGDVSVAQNGSLSVLNGGVLSGATVENLVGFTVSSGAKLYDIKVSANLTTQTTSISFGTCVISGLDYFGTAGTSSAKTLVINSNTKVYDFNATGAGEISIYGYVSGGFWGYDSNTHAAGKGLNLSAIAAHVKLENIVLSGGGVRLRTYNGSFTNLTVVDGAQMYMAGDGYGIQVSSGGVLGISRGGVASNTDVYAGGSMTVSKFDKSYDPNSAVGTIVHDGGQITVQSGAFSLDTIVNSGAKLVVDAGGSATIGWSPWETGTVDADDGAAVTKLERTANIYIGNKTLGVVERADACAGKELSDVVMYIYDNGVAEDTVIKSNGSIDVSKGGVANNTVISSGGYIRVFEDGVIRGAEILAGGSVRISSGGSAYDITVKGNQKVYAGGYVSGAVILAGNLGVSGVGAVAEDIVVSGGSLHIADVDASARNVLIEDGALTRVYNGVIYDAEVIGTLRILGTSDDENAVISAGASGVVINKGGFVAVSNGFAGDVVINSGGSMSLTTAGSPTAKNITVNSSGRIEIHQGVVSGLYIARGASLSTLSGATIEINDMKFAAVADGATPYSVSSGTTVNRLSVESAGVLRNFGAVINGLELYGVMSNFRNVINDTVVYSGGVASMATAVAGCLYNNIAFKAGAQYVNYAGRTSASITGNMVLDLAGATEWKCGDVVGLAESTAGFAKDLVITVKVDNSSTGDYVFWRTGAATTDAVKLRIGNGSEYSLTAAAGEYIYDFNAGIQYSMVADTSLTFKAEALANYTPVAISKTDTLATAGTTVNGTDKAAELIDSDFSGTVFAGTGLEDKNGWLILDTDFADSTNKGKVYGGAASGDITGTVNIKAEGAAIGNLLGGGAADTTNNNINIEIGNAVVATGEGESTETKETTVKALYGGGHGDVEGDINIGINGGNITSQLVGGTVRTTGTADVAGEISLTVKDIEFTGANIVGGSYINFTNNASAASVGSVSVTFAGGTAGDQTTGNGAKVYGGGYAYSTADGLVNGTADYTVTNGVTIDISGGTVGSRLNGRGIFGGVFAAKVEAEVENGVSITLSGADTVAGNIFGGGWAQQGGVSNVTGGVSITIESGVANVIYGGGAHSTSGGSTSVDSVDITVKGGSAKAIYAGGQTTGDVVTGDAAITVTGSFATAANFYGTGWNNADTVAGTSTLNFADYTGDVTGTIANFDEIILSGNTVANLTGAAIDAAALTIDLTGRTKSENAVAELGDKDLDTVAIKVDETVAIGAGSWDIISASDTEIAFTLSYGGDTIALEVGKAVATGIFAGWGIDKAEDTYKFALLA